MRRSSPGWTVVCICHKGRTCTCNNSSCHPICLFTLTFDPRLLILPSKYFSCFTLQGFSATQYRDMTNSEFLNSLDKLSDTCQCAFRKLHSISWNIRLSRACRAPSEPSNNIIPRILFTTGGKSFFESSKHKIYRHNKSGEQRKITAKDRNYIFGR